MPTTRRGVPTCIRVKISHHQVLDRRIGSMRPFDQSNPFGGPFVLTHSHLDVRNPLDVKNEGQVVPTWMFSANVRKAGHCNYP